MPNDTTTQWELVLDQLRQTIDKTSFGNWFSNTKQIGLTKETIQIGVPSDYFAKWLTDHYLDKIQDAMQSIPEMSGLRLEFVPCSDLVISTPQPHANVTAAKNTPSMPQQTAFPFCRPTFGFDNYVKHGGNNAAVTIANLIATSKPGTVFPVFSIIGPPGSGKTTLMGCIKRLMKELQNGEFKYSTFPAVDFLNTFCAKFKKPNPDMGDLHQLNNYDLVCIDDLQSVDGPNKAKTQEELFSIIKHLTERPGPKGQVVITMDRPPNKLQLCGEWMHSLLESGFVATITPPDITGRKALLQAKCNNGWTGRVSDDAIELIARNVTDGDARRLNGVLGQAMALSLVGNHPVVTTELVQEAIRQREGIMVAQTITPDAIMDGVAAFFNIGSKDLVGRSREQRYVSPRHIAIYLCLKYTDISRKELAKRLRRDQSTITISLSVIEGKITDDQSVATTVSKIKTKLGLPPI
ncbi:MAG: DnaA/Hda family protein [Patescibacteria group bacterium]|jgi:chromosomal replication initiator protein